MAANATGDRHDSLSISLTSPAKAAYILYLTILTHDTACSAPYFSLPMAMTNAIDLERLYIELIALLAATTTIFYFILTFA